MIGDLETQSHQQIAPVLPENQRLIVKPNKNVISDDRSNEDTLSTTSDVESVLSEAGSTTSSSAGSEAHREVDESEVSGRDAAVALAASGNDNNLTDDEKKLRTNALKMTTRVVYSCKICLEASTTFETGSKHSLFMHQRANHKVQLKSSVEMIESWLHDCRACLTSVGVTSVVPMPELERHLVSAHAINVTSYIDKHLLPTLANKNNGAASNPSQKTENPLSPEKLLSPVPAAPSKSLEDAGAPVHFCEACEQFKSKDYHDFVKHLSTEHKLTSDDYNYMFGSSSEAEVDPQTPVKSPISVIELGDSPVKDGEAGSGCDWTDGVSYECHLCMEKSQLAGKRDFEDHLSLTHNYTFERYLREIDSEPRRSYQMFTCFFCKQQTPWDTQEISSHLSTFHNTSPESYKAFLSKCGRDIDANFC